MLERVQLFGPGYPLFGLAGAHAFKSNTKKRSIDLDSDSHHMDSRVEGTKGSKAPPSAIHKGVYSRKIMKAGW